MSRATTKPKKLPADAASVARMVSQAQEAVRNAPNGANVIEVALAAIGIRAPGKGGSK